MNISLRKALSLVLAGALAASLAACGGSSGGSSGSSASSGSSSSSGSSASSGSSGSSSTSGSSASSGSSGASSSAAPAAGSDEVSIDVILKTTASEYWGYVQAGAMSYMDDHPEVTVTVKGPSSETAYDEQMNMIETDLNNSSYDAYVIAPLQSDLVANQISGVTKPIVAVDSRITAPEVLSFVGTGNKDAAAMGGKAAVEAAKAAGWTEIKAIMISGVQGDSTAEDRMAGYREGVNAAGGEFLDNEVQYADAVADKAVTCMEAVIQNHPEGIAIIVSSNDDMAMAASRTASGNEAYANTVFCGFDGIKSACEAILSGDETMSVAQEAYEMGYKAVDAAVRAVNGETLEAFIDSGCSIVDASNAQQRMDTLNSYLS